MEVDRVEVLATDSRDLDNISQELRGTNGIFDFTNAQTPPGPRVDQSGLF